MTDRYIAPHNPVKAEDKGAVHEFRILPIAFCTYARLLIVAYVFILILQI